MKCAIMQPTYLPWIGYFDLINSVDYFVFLDDVQFNKRSWQQRNRILLNGKEKLLTVPVLTKGKQQQLINEVRIDYTQNWVKDHIQTLEIAYSKHPYGSEIINLYIETVEKKPAFLSNLNKELIKEIMIRKDLQTITLSSSDIPVSGKKSEYLLNICKYLNVNTYVSAVGSREYIEEEGLFEKSEIEVIYQSFTPFTYTQKNSESFFPYLSGLDLIANVGFSETKKILGYKQSRGIQVNI